MPKGKPKSGGKASPPGKIPLDARVQLVRKSIKNGKISGRRPGRPGPLFEVGYLVDGKYFSGNPPQNKRAARREHTMKIIPAPSQQKAVRKLWSQKAKSPMGELEAILDRIVEEKVDRRVEKILSEKLGTARAAAMNAFSHALQV